MTRAGPPDLILVRHAAPEQRPDAPPPAWGLSDAGRAAAAVLADALREFVPASVWASSEPKAIETAEIIARPGGLGVRRDPAFDEHRRARWPFAADPAAFRARVARVFGEPTASVEGAETAEAATARFAAGIARRAERPLLVVSHGTVLSLYAAARSGGNGYDLWRSLRLPEALLLSGGGALIGRIG